MTQETLMQLADAYGECLYLRTDRHDARQALSDAIDAALAQARSDALEEAAEVCENQILNYSESYVIDGCAKAIRALKAKHD